jgi:hypothetical protein
MNKFSCWGLTLSLLTAALGSQAQSVGVGTSVANPPDASAALEVRATAQGMLVPRLTQTQRDAIATPADGLLIYNTTQQALNTYSGAARSWQQLTVAGSSVPASGFVATSCAGTGPAYSYLKSPAPRASDALGTSTVLSADGLTLVSTAPFEPGTGAGVNPAYTTTGTNVGAVYVFTRSSVNAAWTFQAYIKATNPDNNDYFGGRLSFGLALSGDGNTLAVGAATEDGSGTGINPADNNAATDAGAVYVYTRSAGTWSSQAYIKGPTADANDQFGYSVALSFDGSTLAVGSPGEDGNGVGVNPAANNSNADTGAAYAYVRTGSTWVLQATLKAGVATETSEKMGEAVALSATGDMLVATALGESSPTTGVNPAKPLNGATGSGAAYTYSRTGGTWAYHNFIKASNTGAGDQFGNAVALSGDGNTLAVGANLEDGSGTGINPADNNAAADAGAVYVYTRSAAGQPYAFQAYLKASNTDASDQFGYRVALSFDGNTLATSAPNEDGSGTCANPANDNNLSNSGAAYVLSRTASAFTATGTAWGQTVLLKAGTQDSGDRVGASVALGADGRSLALGAFGEDGSGTGVNPPSDNALSNSGCVYVYAVPQ